jgi:hypothetical protein
MKTIFPSGTVNNVDVVLAGDIGAGDVIVLPGARHAVLVKKVRLGQGGFILTVAPVGDDRPETERLATLTAGIRLHKVGRSAALQTSRATARGNHCAPAGSQRVSSLSCHALTGAMPSIMWS